MSEAPELMSVAPELMSVEQDESCLASSAAPKSVVSDVPPTFVKHRVQPGDSIAKLAERFGVGERELLIDNRIRNPSLIYVGQTLKVRDTKTSPQRPSLPYKVSPGDSLSRIAAKLRASEIVLAQRNQIRDPNHIRAGQILLIPIE
jgi:lysozyme